ncbi:MULTISPECIES: RusA family crossover junction endodeoxyribonuclease [Aerococcus]|nr:MULTISPECIES: RusA family crossover junction endodeoxyribonuclease [Aerococcus]MDL5184749.1 RusA family crossover junction endodeoxyribonuclease [Aerococcus mictus]MDK6371974.1 RusA family crossover junction endodeoxyribonuclease [Aerococcus urinae]MDK7802273.1 RusA family crossover junction endodeoxyribonuclease [Aerococcus urinae]MDK8655922.1 RusA family crossover junction endodeoxyribonuclease [Aerococcus urinae]WIW74006.1 RusA family crossover junction endodeoxyribonuclease [Aerococcus 
MLHTYIVPGECVPKGRPRFTRKGHAFTPKKTRDYENLVKSTLIKAGAKPTDKAVQMEIFVFKGPLKSWTKKLLALAQQWRLLPTKKPDIDNYAKAILDASNGVLYKDDGQVVKLTATKAYAPKACVVINVLEVDQLVIDPWVIDLVNKNWQVKSNE